MQAMLSLMEPLGKGIKQYPSSNTRINAVSDPRNKEKELDIILHQSRFPLEYAKRHVQSLHKSSEADQFVVQNLT